MSLDDAHVASSLATVRKKISDAAIRVGKDPKSIKLLAVSKTKPVELISEAIKAGQLYFGENYVKEAQGKIPQLKSGHQDLKFDLIGALQSNKAKLAVEMFDLIQSVDRPSLIKSLDKYSNNLGKTQKILVQVNISNEESKSGVGASDAADFCHEVLQCKSLSLCGLMSIGMFYAGEGSIDLHRKEFSKMRQLKSEIENKLKINLPELSMGMSGSYEVAVEEGATIVRVGSEIFGERDYGK